MSKTAQKILIVDDEKNLCNVLKRIIQSNGYQVKAVSDSNEALNVVTKYHPDLMILDIIMPGINGRDVCSIVRHLSSHTKIIYFTAKVEAEGEKFRELSKEADGFIRKPAGSKRILSEIASVLNTNAIDIPATAVYSN